MLMPTLDLLLIVSLLINYTNALLVLFMHWRLVVFIIDLFQIVVVVILKMILSY